ncbi:MAG TPA: M48 family metalloprotease [Burkholderiales bacterium]|nr:M48 family metalloprotease [Burkholderiales bacterium]
MSFFEEQDRARRATVRLAVLYGLAVLAIVAAANAMLVPVYYYSSGAHPKWSAFAVVTGVTLAVIELGSLEILARLSIGEAELAALLAGRRVMRGSPDEAERRLINVVDEMAIASGLAAPSVYVLGREKGINAFAAGRSPNQAIVVVTAGALENLSRDELQAVVAHEFSHIINGDIALNLRGVCVLQGIVFLYAIGRFILAQLKDEDRAPFFWLYLPAGIAFTVIGWIGLPFTRWIQGAISREREYLADGSAVRYTRNADALCGALARIRTHGEGSRILNWHAEAMAHMLFAAATHPPLEERMRRANPHVPPAYYFQRVRTPKPSPGEKRPPPAKATAVSVLVASMGEPTPESLAHAAGLLSYLPLPIGEALAQPDGAQAVLLGCLLGADAAARAAIGDENLARKSVQLAPIIAGLDRAYRLPILALALPQVRKSLDVAGRAKFLDTVRAVIQADRRVTLSEFVFITILEAHLASRPASGSAACSDAAGECALVLSLLAHAGSEAVSGFEKGRQALALPLTYGDRFDVHKVSGALARLRQLAPAEKKRLVAACAEVTTADGEVRLAEHELLRAVCSALDCPMPQALAALDERLLRK